MGAHAKPRLLDLDCERGAIHCVHHAVAGAPGAVLMVGGSDGGLDGPAEALYPDLAADLAARGIASLRLDFRIHHFPGPVEEGVHDVLAGIAFLDQAGAERVALVGHSFGGAVVIEAGVRSPLVAAVATLATQTAGAQRVAELAPRPLLLVHGLADRRLPAECSRQLYRLAGQPKRLELLEDARHSLRQRREELRALLLDWLPAAL